MFDKSKHNSNKKYSNILYIEIVQNDNFKCSVEGEFEEKEHQKLNCLISRLFNKNTS